MTHQWPQRKCKGGIDMDRAVIEDNLLDWSDGVNRYCDQFGWSAPKVLKWQAGMLARHLIARTPVAKEERVQSDVLERLKTLGRDNPNLLGEADKKSGKGDTRWYFSDHSGLYGVARDMDLTGSDDDAIYKRYLENKKISRGGQIKVGQRGKQGIFLWKKISMTRAQAMRLAYRIKKHAGRLAAGWTVAHAYCGSPGPALPEKVKRHSGPNAKGYVIDGLNQPGNPTITIANTAPGAASTAGIVNKAILKRVLLMRNHISRLIKNPEEAARTVPDEVSE